MGCACCKTRSTKYELPVTADEQKHQVHLSKRTISTAKHDIRNRSDRKGSRHSIEKNSYDNNAFEDDIQTILNMQHVHTSGNDHVKIEVGDPQAFSHSFVIQRQKAIEDQSYHSAINSWHLTSLQQLTNAIKTLYTRKSLIDCYWIIFYWVAKNISYDTVAYFSKTYGDQTAEGVFRRRRGVCEGYVNLYKYLCDKVDLKCEIVSGYSKGYGFEISKGIPTETDHVWNAVEISGHWYLIESTWGSGYLNDEKSFVREFNPYYFLPRPNEMIYDHLPLDERWQLLRQSINMTQYMQMPKVWPTFFELNLELIYSCCRAHAFLIPSKSYALILIRTAPDVYLSATLKLNDIKIEGGSEVVYDVQQGIYCCFFAPASTGTHKIKIYAKRDSSDEDNCKSALEMILDIKKIPKNLVSFPKTWKLFYDLNLQVVSPLNTHMIKLKSGQNHAEIRIRAPVEVQLTGKLENINGKEIKGGYEVFFDQAIEVWRCYFAPDQDGTFEALVYARKKSDTDQYSSVISFKIVAKQIPVPPLSYPYTWPLFHELGLYIEAPRDCGILAWSDNVPYQEIRMNAPDHVDLSCRLEHDDIEVENGTLTQFDSTQRQWQLLFAPQQTGPHQLIVFARHQANKTSNSKAVVRFDVNVTHLQQSIKFPTIYSSFKTNQCRILEPLNGVLKQGAAVLMHCVIPGAIQVNLQVDSKWIQAEGYNDPILKRSVHIGSHEVTIYAKYGHTDTYKGLVKYFVH